MTPLALKDAPTLIELVFPAQKVSFEAQRERKAGVGQTLTALGSYWKGRKPRSVAIVRETRNGVRPISGAQNEATAMAFGGPRPSRRALRAAPGSRNDWTSCRMAWPFVSAGAHVPHSDETHDPTPSRG